MECRTLCRTYVECRRASNKENRVLINRQWGRNHQQHTRNRKSDSQTKRTSFTEKLAATVGMKPREKEEVTTVTEKRKTLGTVSAITTEANQENEQVTVGTAVHQNERATESKILLVGLGD